MHWREGLSDINHGIAEPREDLRTPGPACMFDVHDGDVVPNDRGWTRLWRMTDCLVDVAFETDPGASHLALVPIRPELHSLSTDFRRRLLRRSLSSNETSTSSNN